MTIVSPPDGGPACATCGRPGRLYVLVVAGQPRGRYARCAACVAAIAHLVELRPA